MDNIRLYKYVASNKVVPPPNPDYTVSNLPTSPDKPYYYVKYDTSSPHGAVYICWLISSNEGWIYEKDHLMNTNGNNIYYNGYYSYNGSNWTLSINNQVFDTYAWGNIYVVTNLTIEFMKVKTPARIRKIILPTLDLNPVRLKKYTS